MTATAKAAKSRDHLLAATRRVLRERGLHGLRVRDVAEAAGVSAGLVMYHYRTTDDLLLAVHEDTQERYLALRSEAARDEAGDAWARLIASFKAGLPPYTDGEFIELLYEMHGLSRRRPRHAVLLTRLWEEEHGLYLRIIRAGQADGLFTVDNPGTAARALLALEDGLALHLVSDNEAVNSAVALTTFTAAAATVLGYRPARKKA